MLVLLGVNHKSAPLAIRERFAFSETDLPGALSRLASGDRFVEGWIVSTCNRVEILALAKEKAGAAAAVKEFLAREKGASLEEIDLYSYLLEEEEAVRHLFRVAAGLDSLVLGEPQVLGQVRRAYELAREAGTTGSIVERLLQQGLSAAKRVRSETGISRHAVSIAFAAVELAKKIFGDLDGRSALLLGAGKMTELAARHLVAGGVRRIVVSNRTYDRALSLAEKFGGEAVNWDDGFAFLDRVDIVVTGTAAPEPILDKARVQKAVRGRRSRPLFFIDIAVPRDVAQDVNQIDNVYVYDIDDLKGVVDANLEERRRQSEIAAAQIEREVEAFQRWRGSLDLTPTIAALRDRLHGIGRGEIDKHRRRLGPLTPQQEAVLEDLTRSVIQKILHPAIRHLKRTSAEGTGQETAGLYRSIFDIPEARQGPDVSGGKSGESPATAARSADADEEAKG